MLRTTTTPYARWWELAIVGVVAILFGLVAIFWPGLTLFTLVFLFGAFALVTGVVKLVAMFRAMGAHQTWWTHLVLALLNLGAGIVAFAYTGMTTLVLLYIIAFWAIAIGVIEIIAAFSTGEFLLAVAGVIALLFGFVLLGNPIAGALAYVTVIGIFAIVRGVMLIVQAVRAPEAPRLMA